MIFGTGSAREMSFRGLLELGYLKSTSGLFLMYEWKTLYVRAISPRSRMWDLSSRRMESVPSNTSETKYLVLMLLCDSPSNSCDRVLLKHSETTRQYQECGKQDFYTYRAGGSDA